MILNARKETSDGMDTNSFEKERIEEQGPAAEPQSTAETPMPEVEVTPAEAEVVAAPAEAKETTDTQEEQVEAVKAQELPAAEDATEVQEAAEQVPAAVSPAEPQTIYRWDYDVQRASDEADRSRKRRSGILTYAIVMTAFFAVSFVILILSLLTGGLSGKNEVSEDGSSTPTVSDRIVYVREDNGESGYLTLQEIYAQRVDGIVAVSTKKVNGTGVGTGFILREDGYIATNYHVVEDATQIVVQLYSGKQYAAELVNYSEVDDLAVIKVEAEDLPVLPVGNSGDVLVGDDVVIIGHPAGLEFGWSTTCGIVSAINREVKIKNADGTLNKKMTLLQTNANVNSGNSGGPMMNLKGEIIGIITMKLSDGYEGMGFAIPIDGAMEILNAIIEKGNADGVDSSVSKGRAVLGVTGFDITGGYYYYIDGDRIRIIREDALDLYDGEFYAEVSGFYISEVSENSTCKDVLQPGDVIFAIDGVTTDSRSKMMAILDEKNVGDEVVIEYDRNGEVFSAKVALIAAE